jgi:hypothetical protein
MALSKSNTTVSSQVNMYATLNSELLTLTPNSNGTYTINVGCVTSGVGVVFQVLIDGTEIMNTGALSVKGMNVIPAPATGDTSAGEVLHPFRV